MEIHKTNSGEKPSTALTHNRAYSQARPEMCTSDDSTKGAPAQGQLIPQTLGALRETLPHAYRGFLPVTAAGHRSAPKPNVKTQQQKKEEETPAGFQWVAPPNNVHLGVLSNQQGSQWTGGGQDFPKRKVVSDITYFNKRHHPTLMHAIILSKENIPDTDTNFTLCHQMLTCALLPRGNPQFLERDPNRSSAMTASLGV